MIDAILAAILVLSALALTGVGFEHAKDGDYRSADLCYFFACGCTFVLGMVVRGWLS